MNEKFNSYIENKNDKIFGYNNRLTDYKRNRYIEIEDNLKLKVNLCLYKTIPFIQFIINTNQIIFPHFEYIIQPPPLGSDDTDVFIQQCNKHVFLYINKINGDDTFLSNDYYKGFQFFRGEIFVFYEIPTTPPETASSSSNRLITKDQYEISNPKKYKWTLISQLYQHSPLAFFQYYHDLFGNYNFTPIVVYGNGKRTHHPLFGYFYYFVYCHNKIITTQKGVNEYYLFIGKNIIPNLGNGENHESKNTRNEKEIFRLMCKSLAFEIFTFTDDSFLETIIGIDSVGDNGNTFAKGENVIVCVKDSTSFIRSMDMDVEDDL